MEIPSDLANKVRANLSFVGEKCEVPGFEEELSSLLSRTGSVLAGGFVLGSITDTLSPNSDLDIYVGYETFRPLLSYFLTIGEYKDTNISSPYDSSFFKKNGILVCFSFQLRSKSIGSYGACSVDLMIAEQGRKVLDVVSNFDFTFCEVWYNGVDVNGTYLQDTLNKRGSMRKEYLPAFLSNNKFTLARYTKYLSKGYKIDLGDIQPGITMPERRIDI